MGVVDSHPPRKSINSPETIFWGLLAIGLLIGAYLFIVHFPEIWVAQWTWMLPTAVCLLLYPLARLAWKGHKALRGYQREEEIHQMQLRERGAYAGVLEMLPMQMSAGFEVSVKHPNGEELVIKNPYTIVEVERAKSQRPQQIAMPASPVGYIPAPQGLPDTYDLVEVFRRATIAPDRVFIGRMAGGRDLYIDSVDALLHGALNAATGRGKTIVQRGLTSQFLAVGHDVILADLKFTIVGKNGLDYRPIAKRLLEDDPIELSTGCGLPRLLVDPTQIRDALHWLAKKELPTRRVMNLRGQQTFKVLYFFIEELIYLSKLYPEISDDIEEILVLGRELGIRLFTVAQNFQAQNIGLNGGTREQFESAWYLGGDDYSGAKLLDMPQKKINELIASHQMNLGRGLTLFRNNQEVHDAQPLRVGMSSNDSVYYLLGRADDFLLPDYILATVARNIEDMTGQSARSTGPLLGGNREAAPRLPVAGRKQDRDEEIRALLEKARLLPRMSDQKLADAVGCTKFTANKVNNILYNEDKQTDGRMDD